ncbi:hypothetical protein Tco_0348231 [Tanacetum coccineum]
MAGQGAFQSILDAKSYVILSDSTFLDISTVRGFGSKDKMVTAEGSAKLGGMSYQKLTGMESPWLRININRRVDLVNRGQGMSLGMVFGHGLGQGDKEMARDVELNPFKDVLAFRMMVEFLEAIPIYLKGTMWVSEGLVDKRIDWNRTPKEGMERGTLRLN